jgi:hypothetical protein
MRKNTYGKTMIAVFSMALLLISGLASESAAADKLGWVGPVYTELAESLDKGI